MARPREFNADNTLERAMQVFWSKGYEAASLDDLCKATGLGRSSLYAAFDNKHELLLQSLDRYQEQGIARISEALARPVPVREAIAGIINDLIDRIVAGPGRRGCFIGNCVIELARHDHEVAKRVRQSMRRVEASFLAALVRAQESGEIAPDADVNALSRFLVAAIQGLRLVGKANPDRAVLEDIASVVLLCLKR